MLEEGKISTRGLKSDAKVFGEMVFDVNSAYFESHSGYDYAKDFFAEAYKCAVDMIGGEDYILSAVMHADERNRSLSEKQGRDVFHYHLHVVYIPVVEKQTLWTKRCKDKALVGTVKETIMQVSNSKKWRSLPALDEQGNPVLGENGKPKLIKSYSIMQDKFFEHMRAAGYDDIERGERGSTDEHLSVTQFKIQQDTQLIEQLDSDIEKQEQRLQTLKDKTKTAKTEALTFAEIESMGRKTIMGKIELTQQECSDLKQLAKVGVTAPAQISDLKRMLKSEKESAQKWRERYEALQQQVKPYLDALKLAPSKVKVFFESLIHEKQQETTKIPHKKRDIHER